MKWQCHPRVRNTAVRSQHGITQAATGSTDLAVVLLSGGMDSCVTVAIARQNHELALLHANYGQRTERRELKAFNDIAQYFQVPPSRRLVADMKYLGAIGGSSLTDPRLDIPTNKESQTDLSMWSETACYPKEREGRGIRHRRTDPTEGSDSQQMNIPSTYVPFRNTHLLAIAVSWAEVLGARKVFIGAVEHDNPCYPDCREAYYKVFNQLIKVGARPDSQIIVEAPLLHLRKSEIVQKGIALKAPFHLSWSCYKNEDKACGTCRSCSLRLEAFKEAGHKDHIPYDAASLEVTS